jgi:starch phosphorylase
MKVAVNGGLNLSILDGWWCEGFNGQNGWAIGAGEEYSDLEYQDEVESRAIYDLLEQEIVPLFYNRSTDGLPRGWIKMMKNAISTLAPVFSTSRMVAEYTKVCYWPSSVRYNKLSSNNFQGANDLAQWRHRLHEQWRHLGVHEISNPHHDPHKVGAKFHVKAKVHLGQLTPADVDVQIYYGPMDSNWEIQEIHIASMKHEKQEHHDWIFTGEIPCNSSGQHGYRIRVLPKHPDLANQLEPGLILWS